MFVYTRIAFISILRKDPELQKEQRETDCSIKDGAKLNSVRISLQMAEGTDSHYVLKLESLLS